jgi:toxoflavin synthase
MSDAYAQIAEGYKKAKLQPWRHFIEEFTLFQLLGGVANRSALDLACGDGFYTRRLRQRGASRVVGVDISARMIDLARAKEQLHPLGITYEQQDAADLSPAEPFDLVVAAYLFNYARTPEQLSAMARAVARSLKPGGRMVAVNNHLGQPIEAFAATEKYGLIKEIDGELREGATITYTLFTEEGPPIRFDNYYLSTQTYEQVLLSAGLGEIRWHAPRLSPEGEAECGRDYWSVFLEQSPIYFLECTRMG